MPIDWERGDYDDGHDCDWDRDDDPEGVEEEDELTESDKVLKLAAMADHQSEVVITMMEMLEVGQKENRLTIGEKDRLQLNSMFQIAKIGAQLTKNEVRKMCPEYV